MTRLVVSIVTLLAAAVSANNVDSPWEGNDSKSPMFMKDQVQVHVLDYLNKFDSLYIKYHSCVWSPYATAAVDAFSSCHRANVAFSLYGVWKDDDVTTLSNNNDPPTTTKSLCTQQTYINSFFTTHGAAVMSNALGINNSSSNNNNADYVTAECTTIQSRESGASASASSSPTTTSATMGCASGRFVYDLFDGDQCDASNYLSTLNTMDRYNEGMGEITCTQVWDYDTFVGGAGGDQRRRLDYGSVAETILSDSKTCSIDQYPGTCPDPYGVKEKYRVAAAARTILHHQQARDWFGLGFMLFIMGMIAAFVYRHRLRTLKQNQQQDPSYRREKASSSGNRYRAPHLGGDDDTATQSSDVNSRLEYYRMESALAATNAAKTEVQALSPAFVRKASTLQPKVFHIPEIIDQLDLSSASSLSSQGTMSSMFNHAHLQAQQKLVDNNGDIPSSFLEELEAAWGNVTAKNRMVV